MSRFDGAPAGHGGFLAATELWSLVNEATHELDAPIAAVSLEAFELNADDVRGRSSGIPVRVASKSIRIRRLIEAIARTQGFRGVLAFTLEEAIWLSHTVGDVLVGYPSVSRGGIRALVNDPTAIECVTLMVDDIAQLDFIDAVVAASRRPELRVCIDIDASLSDPPIEHFGVRRSPLHTAKEVLRLANRVVDRRGFRLVGLMAYEAQIAGYQNRGPERARIRELQRRSLDELVPRRAAIVQKVRTVADLEFVNAGGTGSLEITATDPSVTELTAGSGLVGPHLFDEYESFRPLPAAAFGIDVVRKPTKGIATLLGGGWIASGAAGADRLPVAVHPAELALLTGEGAGEVQTPVAGASAENLEIGDRVWLRHAKAGELFEHVNEVALVDGVLAGDPKVVDVIPTYRGEGKAFL